MHDVSLIVNSKCNRVDNHRSCSMPDDNLKGIYSIYLRPNDRKVLGLGLWEAGGTLLFYIHISMADYFGLKILNFEFLWGFRKMNIFGGMIIFMAFLVCHQ